MSTILNDGEQDYIECPKCAAGRIYSLECDCCGYTDAEFSQPSLSTPQPQPTPEQQVALDQISTWSSDPHPSEPFFTLRGYAGTGKSYCITLYAKSPGVKTSRLCFTAPTNKAVKVLRNYLNDNQIEARTATIYSLLGLTLQANGEVKEISKPEQPVDLSPYDLIIVDEASMINRFLMSAIREAQETWNVKFLFMGDPAQLPPVGETSSPVWKVSNTAELTTVMRYGNSMLDLATSIRKVVDHPFPSIKVETNPPVYRLTKPEWLVKISDNLELFRSGEAKVIAWRNVKVDDYNTFIRGQIFGPKTAKENRWLPDDKIVATAHLKDLDDNTFMRTDEEATILQVALGNHPIHSEFEIFNILALDELGKKVTLRTLTPEGLFAVNNRLNELAMEAKSGKKYKWKEFWKLKEAFHEIRHSYAITSHRSQGSSYLKTFVDLEDIMLNRNRQEAFRSLYVACTRQREELYIC